MVYYVGNSMMAQGMRACREAKGLSDCSLCDSCSERDNLEREREEEKTVIDNKPKKVKKKTYYQYSFPTPNQVNAIRFITMYTGAIFEGRTFYEASEFINKYMEKAQKARNYYIWE